MTRRDFSRTARRPAIMEVLEQRRVLAPLLSLQGPLEVVFEGEQADFTLRLSEPARQAETVFVTTRPGTATLGVDYAAPARIQVSFSPGETVKRFSIATLAEAVAQREGNETFFVTARPVNPRLGRGVTSQVVIGDAGPRPAISVADIRVTEGAGGPTAATFRLTLGAAYQRTVSVAYATRDGSATVADGDYAATSGVVTFRPGETAQNVTVNVNGDLVAEPDETFSLVLSAPVNATLGRSTAVCTIVNDETDQPGYQVTINFIDGPSGPVPQSVRTVAQQAVTRWARIITGDLPAVTANGFFIDDFEMTIQMGLLGGAPTDGPSNVLANARPTAFRNNGTGIPYAGITGLDPADIANTAMLLDTITHEMGHAFGFTPNAAVFSRWFVGDTFIGTNALREYNSIFGRNATSVPLQAGVRGHWDEATFGDELMSPTTFGRPEYISRVTVGALQDMGYTVNYAAAEPYTRPNALTLAPPPASSGGGSSNSGSPATGRPPTSPAAPPPAFPLQPPSGPPAGLKPGLPPVGAKPGSPPAGGKSTLSRVQVFAAQPLSVAVDHDAERASDRVKSATLATFAGLSVAEPAGLPRKASTHKAFASLSAR